MRVMEEAVPVRGAPDQPATLRFTRHGPVLHEEPGRIVAIRSVWFEPGSAPYLRSLVSMRAGSLPEFREAVRGWGVPSVNHVYADAGGTIAWLPAGFTPVRPGWSGLLPARGDGSQEWAGFLDMESLPRVVDPPEGYVSTANEMNLPEGYPHAVGYEWIEGFRAARIREALAGTPVHAVEDSCRLQTDVASIPARRLGRLLAGLEASDADAARALALLAPWDHALDAGSAPAALFGLWWTKHLKPALLALLAPDPEVRALLGPGDLEGLLRALERPDERFGEDPEARRVALLLGTLAQAFADAASGMGPDPGSWAWGLLHRAYFEHPLTPTGRAPNPPEGLDVGPFPHGGDSTTPMHAGYRPTDFRTVAGASVRIVMDVGDWDRSRWINAPGQSGDPRSPHYRDLAEPWARGAFVPMLYSREAVDAACRRRIVLEPARDPARRPAPASD
jgi:penicillin amidase